MTASKHERDELASGDRREPPSWRPVADRASWPDVDPDNRNPAGRHRAGPRNNGHVGRVGYPGWAPDAEPDEPQTEPRSPQHRSQQPAPKRPVAMSPVEAPPAKTPPTDPSVNGGRSANADPAVADEPDTDRTPVERPVAGKGRPVAKLSPSERYIDNRPPAERAAARRAAARTTVVAAVNGVRVGPATATKPAGGEGAADDDDSERPTKPVQKVHKKGSFWKELPILIGVALVLTFLIQTFVARVYVIPSESMETTLHGCDGCVGDRILVDKMTYDFGSPRPGDVIVFKGPSGWGEGSLSEYTVSSSGNPVLRYIQEFGSSIGIGSPPEYDLVKRVIAVGGQTISCCDAQHRVVVDGKPLNEPYLNLGDGAPQDLGITGSRFGPVTIPQGYLWVMGDNRNNSYDSRFQNHAAGDPIRGIVPVGNVIGIARTIIWPPSRWRGVGETNPQTATAIASPPAWTEGLPAGVGVASAWPTLWMGRRLRRGMRAAAGRGAALAGARARRRRR